MYAIRNFILLFSKHFFNQDKIILEDNIFPVLILERFILFWKTIFSDLVTKLKSILSFFNFQILLLLSSMPINSSEALLLGNNHNSIFYFYAIPLIFLYISLFFLGEECHDLVFNKYFRYFLPFTSHRSYSEQHNLTEMFKLI
ncbi:hypothetical protein LEP1GSC132_4521 [Leptospira kirschneri str. 200803703]|nr:hypothetical protein LEP1GSC132_4521 [Leptospira kirschneri str. 200803703]